MAEILLIGKVSRVSWHNKAKKPTETDGDGRSFPYWNCSLPSPCSASSGGSLRCDLSPTSWIPR